MDIVYLLLAAAAGALIYAIIVHKKPGMQPGEAQIDALLAKLTEALHSHSVQQTAALSQVLPAAIARAMPAPAAPTPAPAPSPAAPPPAASAVTTAIVTSAAPGTGSLATAVPGVYGAAPLPNAVTLSTADFGGGGGGGGGAKVVPLFPRRVRAGGATYNAKAPFAPDFEASTMAILLGSQGAAVADPSNGDEVGRPLRSDAGFPLQYTVANGTVIGTPTIVFGDQGFNSDAEVRAYQAARGARLVQLEEVARQHAADAAAPDLKPGQVDIRTLAPEDGVFFAAFYGELWQKVGPGATAQQVVNWAGWQTSTAPVDGWPTPAPRIDVAAYAGPLRALLGS